MKENVMLQSSSLFIFVSLNPSFENFQQSFNYTPSQRIKSFERNY